MNPAISIKVYDEPCYKYKKCMMNPAIGIKSV